jgi:hypothetical protein
MLFDELMHAVLCNNARTLRCLLSNASPALVNAVNVRDHTTLLGEAVSRGRGIDVGVVELLLRAGADTSVRCGRRVPGRPLHHSVRSLECTELLLRYGADIGARNCLGETALITAARCGASSHVILRLLAAGADPQDVDGEGNAAINYAIIDGHEHILQLLLAANAVCSSEQIGHDFLLAARDQHVECAHLLIAAGYELSEYERSFVACLPGRHWDDIDEVTRIARFRSAINHTRVSFIRWRACDICAALQSMRINALQLTLIVEASCPLARFVPFHSLWQLVTTVKHFHDRHARA